MNLEMLLTHRSKTRKLRALFVVGVESHSTHFAPNRGFECNGLCLLKKSLS